ncbi:hypothetical protein [Saccharicrinis aurantiacus]|uniref:hypothetical protein n=1 Tax=Saccharicrinis aurantiacus TaxID=1849719 RepID=UPI002493B3C9|nr:hypothetical protein [Saccharicrinis aurantiacus]
MRIFKQLIVLLGIMNLLSCSHNINVDEEFGNIPENLKIVYKELGSKKQHFTIDATQSNTIVGNQGTVLLVPENSIVDFNGKLTQSVNIELKENFTISDFIFSNLQTLHGNDILVSNGMIHYSAKDSSGNDLRIKDGHSIRIQIPQKDINNNNLIFIGERDISGTINWSNAEEPTKTLVPYPIKFISKNRYWTECLDYYGIVSDTTDLKHYDYNYFGNMKDFENTILATKEFKDRFSWTCWDSVFNLYVNNLEKEMWVIDEMVIEFLKRDSIRSVKWWLETFDSNKYVKNKAIEDIKKFKGWEIKMFQEFASQKLTTIDSKLKIDTSVIKDINQAFISYDGLKFGWVNVDYFYNNPKSEQVKLVAHTNLSNAVVNLIFKNDNVILNGLEKRKQEYWFTKDLEGYNRLPIGDTAIIIGIGLIDNKLVFDKREFIIDGDKTINLDFQEITGENLANELKKYGS